MSFLKRLKIESLTRKIKNFFSLNKKLLLAVFIFTLIVFSILFLTNDSISQKIRIRLAFATNKSYVTQISVSKEITENSNNDGSKSRVITLTYNPTVFVGGTPATALLGTESETVTHENQGVVRKLVYVQNSDNCIKGGGQYTFTEVNWKVTADIVEGGENGVMVGKVPSETVNLSACKEIPDPPPTDDNCKLIDAPPGIKYDDPQCIRCTSLNDHIATSPKCEPCPLYDKIQKSDSGCTPCDLIDAPNDIAKGDPNKCIRCPSDVKLWIDSPKCVTCKYSKFLAPDDPRCKDVITITGEKYFESLNGSYLLDWFGFGELVNSTFSSNSTNSEPEGDGNNSKYGEKWSYQNFTYCDAFDNKHINYTGEDIFFNESFGDKKIKYGSGSLDDCVNGVNLKSSIEEAGGLANISFIRIEAASLASYYPQIKIPLKIVAPYNTKKVKNSGAYTVSLKTNENLSLEVGSKKDKGVEHEKIGNWVYNNDYLRIPTFKPVKTGDNEAVAGKDINFTIKPYLFFGDKAYDYTLDEPADIVIEDILPKDMSYIPDSASIKPDVLTDSPARGYTTIMWKISGVRKNSDIPIISYKTSLDMFTPNETYDYNWIRMRVGKEDYLDGCTKGGYNGFIAYTSPLKIGSEENNSIGFNSCTHATKHRVNYNNISELKTLVRQYGQTLQDTDTVEYEIKWGRVGQELKTYDLINVLPYKGDGVYIGEKNILPRSPATNINGYARLAKPLSINDAVGMTPYSQYYYYTNQDPAKINRDPRDASNAINKSGSTKWCLMEEFGQAECPKTLDDATAYRIVDLNTYADGYPVSQNYTLKFTQAEKGQVITSNFSIATPDLNSIGNSINFTNIFDKKKPELKMTKTCTIGDLTANDCLTHRPGVEVKYTIKVENIGDTKATGVEIEDDYDEKLLENLRDFNIPFTKNEAVDGNFKIFWSGQTINFGESLTLTYVANVKTTAEDKSIIKNIAKVNKNDQGVNNPGPVEAVFKVIRPQPTLDKLCTTKGVTDKICPVVRPGDVARYTLKFGNDKSADLNDILITDDYDENLLDTPFDFVIMTEEEYKNFTDPTVGLASYDYPKDIDIFSKNAYLKHPSYFTLSVGQRLSPTIENGKLLFKNLSLKGYQYKYIMYFTKVKLTAPDKSNVVNWAELTDSDNLTLDVPKVKAEFPVWRPQPTLEKFCTTNGVTDKKCPVVRPGDVAKYTLKFSNTLSQPLKNITITDKYDSEELEEPFEFKLLNETEYKNLADPTKGKTDFSYPDSVNIFEKDSYIWHPNYFKIDAGISLKPTIKNSEMEFKDLELLGEETKYIVYFAKVKTSALDKAIVKNAAILEDTDPLTEDVPEVDTEFPVWRPQPALDKWCTTKGVMDKRCPAVRPGDMVKYTLKFNNTLSAPLNQIQIDDDFEEKYLENPFDFVLLTEEEYKNLPVSGYKGNGPVTSDISLNKSSSSLISVSSIISSVSSIVKQTVDLNTSSSSSSISKNSSSISSSSLLADPNNLTNTRYDAKALSKGDWHAITTGKQLIPKLENGHIIFENLDLQGGETKYIVYFAKVKDTTPSLVDIINTAVLTDKDQLTQDVPPVSALIPVVIPKLVIEKICTTYDGSGPDCGKIKPKEFVDYTIKVTNVGSDKNEIVTLTDDYDDKFLQNLKNFRTETFMEFERTELYRFQQGLTTSSSSSGLTLMNPSSSANSSSSSLNSSSKNSLVDIVKESSLSSSKNSLNIIAEKSQSSSIDYKNIKLDQTQIPLKKDEGGILTWENFSLYPGQSVVFKYNAQVKSNAYDGLVIENLATVKDQDELTVDPDPVKAIFRIWTPKIIVPTGAKIGISVGTIAVIGAIVAYYGSRKSRMI